VEIGTILVTVLFAFDLLRGERVDVKVTAQLIVWLWFTVLFASFAEAMAEGRGKAQAATLRQMRVSTTARRVRKSGESAPLRRDARAEEINATDLKKGDVVLVEANQTIPADGEILEGVASVDESA